MHTMISTLSMSLAVIGLAVQAAGHACHLTSATSYTSDPTNGDAYLTNCALTLDGQPAWSTDSGDLPDYLALTNGSGMDVQYWWGSGSGDDQDDDGSFFQILVSECV
ncbi:hypothetical protein GGR56DRAFT_295117 [Xylariaceae sp. FL0804]|nr:hypothetical protein GGR56DRAFT_295117 [Xylariaceae sp. FL0804]